MMTFAVLGKLNDEVFPACVKMMNFVLKTRNCVSKTRNFALKMMNFAGDGGSASCISLDPNVDCSTFDEGDSMSCTNVATCVFRGAVEPLEPDAGHVVHNGVQCPDVGQQIAPLCGKAQHASVGNCLNCLAAHFSQGSGDGGCVFISNIMISCPK